MDKLEEFTITPEPRLRSKTISKSTTNHSSLPTKVLTKRRLSIDRPTPSKSFSSLEHNQTILQHREIFNKSDEFQSLKKTIIKGVEEIKEKMKKVINDQEIIIGIGNKLHQTNIMNGIRTCSPSNINQRKSSKSRTPTIRSSKSLSLQNTKSLSSSETSDSPEKKKRGNLTTSLNTIVLPQKANTSLNNLTQYLNDNKNNPPQNALQKRSNSSSNLRSPASLRGNLQAMKGIGKETKTSNISSSSSTEIKEEYSVSEETQQHVIELFQDDKSLNDYNEDVVVESLKMFIEMQQEIDEVNSPFKTFSFNLQHSKLSLFPSILQYPSDSIDRFVDYIKSISTKIIMMRRMINQSHLLRYLIEKNIISSIEDNYINLLQSLLLYIPLFEEERINIEKRIEFEEIILQFKESEVYEESKEELLNISEINNIKRGLTNALGMINRLMKSIQHSKDFLLKNDIMKFIKQSFSINEMNKVFEPLYKQLNEEKIIHYGICHLKIPTTNSFCRYQKCLLIFTYFGFINYIIYPGNTIIPCDFISSKRLVCSDIEIRPPEDDYFSGELYIYTKNTTHKKIFQFAFEEQCELNKWNEIIKNHLMILDLQSFNSFEYENCIATNVFDKKIQLKKGKYVGSSVDELMDYQKKCNCMEHLPDVLNKCINEIIRKGLQEDGLFRKPPDQYQLEELMKKLNDADFRSKVKLNEYPTGTLCGLLKAFLMEMNPRFINGNSYDLFVKISQMEDVEMIREQIYLFIESLSDNQKKILNGYLYLLNIIASNERLNRMGQQNLSTAICQCFLPQKNNVDFASIENDSFKELLIHYDMFLPEKNLLPQTFPNIMTIIKKQNKKEESNYLSCIIEKRNQIWLFDREKNITEINYNSFVSVVHSIELPEEVIFEEMKYMEATEKMIVLASKNQIVTFDMETKTINKIIKRKEINCLVIFNDMIVIGEQNGIIEFIDPMTLTMKNELIITPKHQSISEAITSISQIVIQEDIMYVSFVQCPEISIVSLETGEHIKTIYFSSPITPSNIHLNEESLTLWISYSSKQFIDDNNLNQMNNSLSSSPSLSSSTGNMLNISGNGNTVNKQKTSNKLNKIQIIDIQNHVLLKEITYPQSYGNCISIQSIPQYVFVVFSTGRIVFYDSATYSMISSISNEYFTTCKWSRLIRRHYNDKFQWNLWMEKDNFDVGVVDISFPSELTVTEDIILKVDNYLENRCDEMKQMSHFFTVSNCLHSKENQKIICCVCEKEINDLKYECLNCHQSVHVNCIDSFLLSQCITSSTIIKEILNKRHN